MGVGGGGVARGACMMVVSELCDDAQIDRWAEVDACIDGLVEGVELLLSKVLTYLSMRWRAGGGYREEVE